MKVTLSATSANSVGTAMVNLTIQQRPTLGIGTIGVAVNMLHNDQFRGLTESATHYHTDYVNPTWNTSMNYIGRIGNHLFYLETR